MRAAILSIWVAVCADIISKMRELAADGDAVAAGLMTSLDTWITNDTRQALQKFENDLLELAENQFQFLSRHEAQDLKRLQQDRHWCAHPAFVSPEGLFKPSPEQARAHIVHAISHLLAHPPIQGKSIVLRFHHDLLGGAVPNSEAQMQRYITAILARMRDSSSKEFASSLIAVTLGTDGPQFVGKEELLVMALRAMAYLRPGIVESALPGFIEKKGETLADNKLLCLCRFMRSEPRIWEWLGEIGQTRLASKIANSNLPELLAIGAFDAIQIPQLSTVLASRWDIDGFRNEAEDIAERNPHELFVIPILDAYGDASSFASADRIGRKFLLAVAEKMNTDHLVYLAQKIRENNPGHPYHQILRASETPQFLYELFSKTKHLGNIHPGWIDILEFISSQNLMAPMNALISAMRDSGYRIPGDDAPTLQEATAE